MIEAIQLYVFQLFYIFICKRLVLMGKTIHFFNHLNVYCPVCCLLYKLNCVLWVSGGSCLAEVFAPGVWRGMFGAMEAPWGPAGGQSPLGPAASLCFGLPSVLDFMVWFRFFLSFLSTHFVLFFLLLNLTCILSF